MDVSTLSKLSSSALEIAQKNNQTTTNTNDSFGSVFSQALNLVSETNDFQNSAESAEIQFALGESTSTHDLLVAQEKANIALQFTVAVRDKVLEAYKEIMNMQI